MPVLKSFAVFLLFVQTQLLLACTAFHWKGAEGAFAGKSYDWNHSQALLITNKRGVKKQGFTIKPWESGPTWTSRLGSVTFNQYGREFPNGGMNEAGLIVEVLWLNSSEYEGFDYRPVLNQLTWVQYQLDNFSRVSEVIAALPQYRMSPIQGKIHYFVCDAEANCAVVEWLKGKPVVHSGAQLNPQAITNHTYEESLVSLRGFQAQLQLKTSLNSTDQSSLNRFKRVVEAMKTEVPSVDQSFNLLSSVRIPELTTWHIVYDITRKEIHYRTKANEAIRRVQVDSFDFDCKKEVQMLGIDEGTDAVNPLFTPFDENRNYAVIQESLNDVNFAWVLGPMLSRYPGTTVCAQ